MGSSWHTVRLGELVASITAGTSVNGEERPRLNEERAVLKVSAVSDAGLRPNECKVVSGAEIGRLSTPVLAGTIVFSRSNTPGLVGLSAYVDKDDSHLYHSDKLWQIRANEERVLTRYLAFLLRNSSLRLEFTKRASGSSGSMYNISQNAFLGCVTTLPGLCEQGAILSILDTGEASVRAAEALIEKKVERKRIIANDLLTGSHRLSRDSEGWSETSLGNLFRERVEIGRLGLRLLSVTGSGGVVDRESLTKRDTSSEDKSKYLRVCPGDIAYNTMRMWQGVCGLSALEGIVSPAYTVCVPQTDRIVPEYAAHLFKLPHTINDFKRHSQGLVDDTLNLKFHHFSRIRVRIPSIDEQRRIVSVLRALDEEVTLLRRQRAALDAQRKTLMQKLLTGEVRLKEFRT